MHGGTVAILAQEPFPVRTCTVFFPFTSASGFALSKCVPPSFAVSPTVLMAPASDGTDVSVSPFPASSSKMGSTDGCLPDLEGTGYRASTMEENQ